MISVLWCYLLRHRQTSVPHICCSVARMLIIWWAFFFFFFFVRWLLCFQLNKFPLSKIFESQTAAAPHAHFMFSELCRSYRCKTNWKISSRARLMGYREAGTPAQKWGWYCVIWQIPACPSPSLFSCSSLSHFWRRRGLQDKGSSLYLKASRDIMEKADSESGVGDSQRDYSCSLKIHRGFFFFFFLQNRYILTCIHTEYIHDR